VYSPRVDLGKTTGQEVRLFLVVPLQAHPVARLKQGLEQRLHGLGRNYFPIADFGGTPQAPQAIIRLGCP
jgi:hypothetical protein